MRDWQGHLPWQDDPADARGGLTVASISHFSRGPRVYPTRFGAAFLGMSLLTLVGCVNYQLSLGYLLTFLLLGLWVSGAVAAARSLSGLRLSAAPPEEAWSGEEARFSILLENPSEEPRYGLRLRLARPRSAPETVSDIPAKGQARAELTLLAAQRGWLPLPRLRLEGRDPLGLWRGVVYPHLSAKALVYPAPEEGAPPPPAQPIGAGSGELRLGGQEDFAGVRPYVPGDAPRQVSWRHSARMGTLHSKVYDAPAATTLHFRYGVLGGLSEEERLSRLCTWVLRAHQEGLPFTLELPQLTLTGQGEGHVRQSLSALALFGQGEA